MTDKASTTIATPPNKYHDNRSEFFSKYFKKAVPYENYLQTGSQAQRDKWNNYAKSLSLSNEHKLLLKEFKRQMNILVLSGIWCGDCARQGAMLRELEKQSSLIDCRYIDNRENPELQNELRLLGAERLPMLVFLSEDFYEVQRIGDRTLSAYLRKVRDELGPACDAGLVQPSNEELASELAEWLSVFLRVQLMLRLAPALRARYQD